MTDQSNTRETEQWWETTITEITPEAIRIRGYAIEDLIGRIGFIDMLWLLVRGELPVPAQSQLLEATLLGGAVHGPHAPSIAIARMAITCGVDINQAIGQGAAVLGDVHGGAIEQCMELFASLQADATSEEIKRSLINFREKNGKFVPGFGHRFHKSGDPRTPRIMEIAKSAAAQGVIKGHYIRNALEVEHIIAQQKGKYIPMNLDGAAGAVFLELGFSPAVGRGLIVLSRTLGILANAWEETQQGGRLKGPVPSSVGYAYTGPAPRKLPKEFED